VGWKIYVVFEQHVTTCFPHNNELLQITIRVRGKGKDDPRAGHEGAEGEMGVGGQRDAPAALPPGKTRYSSFGT
jgi:hypothetical protein